ncbi:MAG: hypothetical protein KJ674_02850 [Nanoarchaeota archaeon]|nr:hypothetical protein [Nanoarchaeota archaeon]
MAKIHLPINISFLIILLGVIFLGIIQGQNITNSLIGEEVFIGGGEIQQIAFIILTLFILIVTTLHPTKVYLAAYSSMTLGLIVVIGSLYNRFNDIGSKMGLIEIIVGFVLILGGFFLFKGSKISRKEKKIAVDEINKYMK